MLSWHLEIDHLFLVRSSLIIRISSESICLTEETVSRKREEEVRVTFSIKANKEIYILSLSYEHDLLSFIQLPYNQTINRESSFPPSRRLLNDLQG